MPLPTFAPPTNPPTRAETLNRTQAAARLGLNGPGVDKLVRAGLLGLPIRTDDVERLMGRDRLQVTEGELSVLRTDARAQSDRSKYPMDDRKWVGFHVQHTDDELAESSLRWWRCDPERVVDNELLAVTVATFPVAVYRILGKAKTIVRADETTSRHAFTGQLLGRVHPGMSTTFPQDTPGHLHQMARQIMNSRIAVSSGGPIGYLEPGTRT
jgi:hypothetical protein